MENQWPSLSKILSRQEITLKCAELPEAAMVIKKSEKLCLVSVSAFPRRTQIARLRTKGRIIRLSELEQTFVIRVVIRL